MKKIISILVLLAIVVGVFNLPGMNFTGVAADTKTITVNFKTNPTPGSVSVTKTPLKYNKGFAFSFTADDSYVQGYDPVFRYLNGGYVTELGQTVEGLYSSDGTGYRVPFKGGFNWLTVNSNFTDVHIDTPSYMTWSNLQEVYALGWEPINHGWTSEVTPTPPSTIINYPAPHGPSTIDYNYEITQNTAALQTHLGATIKHFGLPAGDTNYTSAAWANGMKTIYTGQTNSNNYNDGLMNAGNTLNLNNLTIERKYFADQTTLQDMKAYIDNLANTSTGGAKYWGVASAHRVRTSSLNPDNGNLSFVNFKNFMDYVSNTYGIKGNDSLWMASSPEIYEYLVTKQKTVVSTNLVGSVLTITLDHSLVDSDLRRYALSLEVSADAEIDSISYGSGFTHTSENISTGLINLDWGFVTLSNDFTRCETLTVAAETSRTQVAIDTARTYVNLLESGSTKNAFTARLNNIIIKPIIWKVGFGFNGSAAGAWNTYGGDVTIPGTLSLKDGDGNVSSATVGLQTTFTKGANGKTSGSNTGYFPDAYLVGNIHKYSASTDTTPGIVRLGGLNVAKKYELVLMGSLATTGLSADKTTTVYSVNGTNKELQTFNNTNNVVTYNNLSPNSNSNIDISVAKKYANWGYGILNALELTETTENIAEYSVTFDANSGIGGTGPTTLDQGTALTAPTVTRTGYTFAGWSPTMPATVPGANTTYTAQWAIDTYTITWAASGGSGGGANSCDHGA
ncbi:MAG: InlB B-repeat-containing protein, partial [Eubacteriales bacterium]